MRNYFLACVVALGYSIALCGTARGADKYQYIVDATNRIIQLDSESASPSADDLAKAGSEACQALKQLIADPEFKRDLEKMKSNDLKTRGERASMKRDLVMFVNAFLRPEQDALRKAGINDQAVTEIRRSANMFQQFLDNNFDPQAILSALNGFQNEVCQSAVLSGKTVDIATRRALIEKWAFRIGGVAIIAVDAGSTTMTAGVSAGSIAIGAGIMTWDAPK
jgi:hypothetical protein